MPKHINIVTGQEICESFSESLEVAFKKCGFKTRRWVTKGQATRLAEILAPTDRYDRHHSDSVKLRLSRLPEGHSGVRRTELRKGTLCETKVRIVDDPSDINPKTGEPKYRLTRVSHTYYNVDQCYFPSI